MVAHIPPHDDLKYVTIYANLGGRFDVLCLSFNSIKTNA